MATFMIRNLPDEIHRALRVRAANHGRSLEAEVRAILESQIEGLGSKELGSRLTSLGKHLQGFHFDIALSSIPRQKRMRGA